MKQQDRFPITPIEDWIIIKRIDLPSKADIKMTKLDIISAGGLQPKNIMDIERKKASEVVTYEDAENEILKNYDEHPWQAVVMAVGLGRYINSTEIIRMPDLKPGNKILIRGRVGEPIVIDKKLYWAVKPHEIFGVVKSI